ncbi:hypothetical protein FA95DRAFT_1680989 [Auriscalpium vulgare]|uniref:Uncharacterized protein n=1 Tax=Auriscalpium vulgare TaxID=40419 RepID=A0ACB8RM57_9AGAM|nr:hypothetical protein FA95DRAFT_1680989 [Auriscalpium vulgare]
MPVNVLLQTRKRAHGSVSSRSILNLPGLKLDCAFLATGPSLPQPRISSPMASPKRTPNQGATQHNAFGSNIHSTSDDLVAANTVFDTSQLQKYNELIPIARLHPEILAAIFTLLPSIDPVIFISMAKYRLGWLIITHVCQRCRPVALHQPTLWASSITVPFAMGRRWAVAFLSRAQEVPLTIKWPLKRRRRRISPVELAFLGTNLARTRALQAFVTDDSLPAVCTPAPLLHSLDIALHSRNWDSPHSSPQFPDSLVGGAAGPSSLRGEFSEMLDALERMTALEELILRLELEGSAVNALHRDRVALATLRSLELHASLADASVFLSHIALPADVSVQGHLDYTGSKESHTRALFPAVAQHLNAPATAPITQVRIVRESEKAVKVVAWRVCEGENKGGRALQLDFLDTSGCCMLQNGLVLQALMTLASVRHEGLAV